MAKFTVPLYKEVKAVLDDMEWDGSNSMQVTLYGDCYGFPNGVCGDAGEETYSCKHNREKKVSGYDSEECIGLPVVVK